MQNIYNNDGYVDFIGEIVIEKSVDVVNFVDSNEVAEKDCKNTTKP